MSETPTIEADPSWPAWAEYLSIDAMGARELHEYKPPAWWDIWSRTGVGRTEPAGVDRNHDGTRYTVFRIVRTPKEAAPTTMQDAFAPIVAWAKAAQALAVRLTQHGPADANYARNALIAAGIPVPALVERKATGVDKEETKDA
jgi:hypothetical protein